MQAKHLLAALSFVVVLKWPIPHHHPPLAAAELPNDCAIVAAESYVHVSKISAWSKVLLIRMLDLTDFKVIGHAVTVFQISEDGPIFLYDRDGTYKLKTKSKDLTDIILELNSKMKTRIIIESSFVEL